MKNLLLFAAVTVIGFSVAQSQELRLGAKAGVNFASIGGDGTDGIDGRTSFHVGALVEIPINEKFAVQPELLFSSLGAKQEFSEAPADVIIEATSKLKFDYINVPIMAKYYVINGLALEAGPHIGILISAKADTEIDVKGNVPHELIELIKAEFGNGEQDIKDNYNTLDFGLGLGASYRLDMGVFFGLRYTLGLSNINKDSDDYKNQNNVFQVSVGYSF